MLTALLLSLIANVLLLTALCLFIWALGSVPIGDDNPRCPLSSYRNKD